MSLSNINIQIVGRLGNDCTVRQVKDFHAISFSIAVSEKRQNDQQVTSWINCTYWTKGDKIAQYLTKGKLVSMVADWFDVTDKEGKTYTNFRVKELNPFLERSEPTQATPLKENEPTKAYDKNVCAEDEDDDLPF